MLDLKYVTAHPDLVKQNCLARNVGPEIVAEVDRVVALEGGRRAMLGAVEDGRRRQNEVAQATGKEKDPARRAELVAEGKRLKGEAGDIDERLKALDSELKRPRPDPQPDPPRRPDRRDRGPERRGPQGRHPPVLRLPGEGPRRPRQGARPDRLRGRRQGRRAPGSTSSRTTPCSWSWPSSSSPSPSWPRRGSPRSSRPTWRGTASSKGSASPPGGPRRRSIRSRTPTSA